MHVAITSSLFNLNGIHAFSRPVMTFGFVPTKKSISGGCTFPDASAYVPSICAAA